eukprot:Hpha_TRINITY_DN12255_c0_g1::TRINITY_DN12255_c0_g1_i2::g.17115::m.17115
MPAATLHQLAEAAWRTAQKNQRLRFRKRFRKACACEGSGRLEKLKLITHPSAAPSHEKRLRHHRALRLTLSAERCLTPSRIRASTYKEACSLWTRMRAKRQQNKLMSTVNTNSGSIALAASLQAAGCRLRPTLQQFNAPKMCHRTSDGVLRSAFSDFFPSTSDDAKTARSQPIPLLAAVTLEVPPAMYDTTYAPSAWRSPAPLASAAAASVSAAPAMCYEACFGRGPPCFVEG